MTKDSKDKEASYNVSPDPAGHISEDCVLEVGQERSDQHPTPSPPLDLGSERVEVKCRV